MIKIIRMWRIVKRLEKIQKSPREKPIPILDLLTEMNTQVKNPEDLNIKFSAAITMAEDEGYVTTFRRPNIISDTLTLIMGDVSITTKGMLFTDFISLLNALAKSIDVLLSIIAIFISVLALGVSLINIYQ